MPRLWLNLFVDQSGVSPQSQAITVSEIAKTLGLPLNLIESDHSGSVILSNNQLSSYGNAEVYLKITFRNGTFSYLSAPLHTSVEVQDVEFLELSIVFLTGPPGTPYRALVNAHCVYEVLGQTTTGPEPITGVGLNP
jgi:hypothetical protein